MEKKTIKFELKEDFAIRKLMAILEKTEIVKELLSEKTKANIEIRKIIWEYEEVLVKKIVLLMEKSTIDWKERISKK